MFRIVDGVNNFFPLGQIGFSHIQLQLLTNDFVYALVVQQFWNFVNAVFIRATDDGALFHITEQGNFAFFIFWQHVFHAAHQDVRLQTNRTHFFDRMLGRFGFDFTRGGDVRHVRQMHKQGVGAAQLAAHLADGFQEWQRLNVAYRATDFHYRHLVVSSAHMHFAFDFVGDVRNHLYRAAQIITATLFCQHFFIHLTRGEVVRLVHGGIDETLVVAQIQVGFGAVFGYKHFTVLKRAHRAWVYVNVRV